MDATLIDFLGDGRVQLALGVLAAVGATWVATLRIDDPARCRALWRWLAASVLFGLLAARAAYVIGNAGAFADAPLRALAVWEGGLSGQAAMVAVTLVSAVSLSGARANLGPLLSVIAIGLVAGQGAAVVSGPGPALPDPALRYETLDGTGFDLASQTAAGRPVVLNLWATWCGPCRRELPVFEAVLAEHDDITFAFASQREPADRVALYLLSEGIDLPNVVFDTDGALGRRYASFGLPTTLFLGADGAVRAVNVGEMSRAQIEAEIDALRAEEGAP